MVDYSDDNFSTVEMIANGKKLYLVCNGIYQLRDDSGSVLYWSYYLKDISNFLENYNA